MSVEVTCNCGWSIKATDPAIVTTTTRAHDAVCPLLFKPDVTTPEPTPTNDKKNPVDHNTVKFTLSREAALDFGLVEPTPEEATRRNAELTTWRAKRDIERAQPGPPVGLEAILELIGWTPAYATHRLHPACTCTQDGEGTWLCDWAITLGFTCRDALSPILDPPAHG
ncbi:MAG: hypothetical protein ACOH10_12915 [Rhodoglobus sp.]